MSFTRRSMVSVSVVFQAGSVNAALYLIVEMSILVCGLRTMMSGWCRQ